ncbi:hypothetical protein EMCRGX_G007842 [Ephydatia muelleri]
MVFHDESLVKTTSQVSSPGVLLHLPSDLTLQLWLDKNSTLHTTANKKMERSIDSDVDPVGLASRQAN